MKKSAVPDAWEDDWEAQADTTSLEEGGNQDRGASPGPAPALTKAERITKHEEANRKIWESADSSPQTFHYLEANSTVPLTTSFKPQVKVLSRKPVIAKRGITSGSMAQLSIDDDEDEDADQEKKDVQLTAEEIRARQKRDLEERQRRYDEARAKIFGNSNPSSRNSSPGTVTPPRAENRHSGKARARAGGGQRHANNHAINETKSNSTMSGHDARAPADARKSVNQASTSRELYDPNFSPKPDPLAQRRGGPGEGGSASGRGTPSRDNQSQYQPIRSPRGPDGSGRGGFGFTGRGNKAS